MHPIAVTGLGRVLPGSEECDPRPWLRSPKDKKFMGPQDAMAVVAAGRAIEDAGLASPLGERTGLFLVVGHIPFEEDRIAPITDASERDGAFSMERFSTEALRAVRPLVTFRCLPNMPAFHVSTYFGVQGPYAVLYPGPAQLYLALEQALLALESGAVDRVLWGGVAHRRNFLVEHHFARLDPGATPDLADGAGFAVLESEDAAASRGATVRARLLSVDVEYRPHDPFEEGFAQEEQTLVDGDPTPVHGDLGPASLPVALASAARGSLAHDLRTRDGLAATSRWEVA